MGSDEMTSLIEVASSWSPITIISDTSVPSIASSATGTAASMVTRIEAAASFNWNLISSAPYVGLTVVTVPPATAAPWKATAYSGRLGETRASVSPGPNPRDQSFAASSYFVGVRTDWSGAPNQCW